MPMIVMPMMAMQKVWTTCSSTGRISDVFSPGCAFFALMAPASRSAMPPQQ